MDTLTSQDIFKKEALIEIDYEQLGPYANVGLINL